MQHLFCVIGIFCLILNEVSSQCSEFNPCGFTGGNEFREPKVLRSIDGKLQLTLTVEMANLTFDWFSTIRRTYNGSVPGPTWRIRPGDNVTVVLLNNLEVSIGLETNEINGLLFPNITNLHTHGLHISSERPQDNSFIRVGPGENYTYEYQILDDHPAGTYWYHPHLHGSVTLQIMSGMAGILIVEDPTSGPAAMPQHLADISCPDNCQHEVLILIQPLLEYADFIGIKRGFAQLQERYGDNELFRELEITSENITLAEWLTSPLNGVAHRTVNGELYPKLTIQAGQKKRFRMVNSDSTLTMDLVITDENANTPATNCEVWEIAFDGMYVNEVRKPRLGRSFMNPAQRVDWIVVCNEPGTYELRSVGDTLDRCSIGISPSFNSLLATIIVTGESQTPTIQETALPIRPFYVLDFLSTAESEIIREGFEVELSAPRYLNREKFSGEKNFRYKLPVGSIQEWHVTNTDEILGHPLHMHINHFQIVSYNPYTGPVSLSGPNENPVLYSQNGELCTYQFPAYAGRIDDFQGVEITNGSGGCPTRSYVDHSIHSTLPISGTIGYVSPGEFRDTLMVPPLSNITIRFMAHKFTGTMVVHCHILFHSDDGMTMVVQIVDEDEDTFVDQTTLSNRVGQCGSGITPISLNSGLISVMLLNLFIMMSKFLTDSYLVF